MRKTLTFTVELDFESEIVDDKDVMVVAENIATAIEDGTNGRGIAPTYGDTYVEAIRVTPQFIPETVTKNLLEF